MVEDYPSYLRLLLPPTFIDSFGAESATELCKTLAVNTVLTALEISIKHICDKGATALSKMLAVNTVLTALVLENNSIRDAGAIELSNALATNTVLTELDLCCNNIGAASATALSTTLATNTMLTSLSLGCNRIGAAGATAFSILARGGRATPLQRQLHAFLLVKERQHLLVAPFAPRLWQPQILPAMPTSS